MYKYSTNHRKTFNRDLPYSYDCKYALTGDGVNGCVSDVCSQMDGAASAVEKCCLCKFLWESHFFGIIKKKILPILFVDVSYTCVDNPFTPFFKTVSPQKKSFAGLFEKSTHVDKMKKHVLKIICVAGKYFSSEKKSFAGLFEKSTCVRGRYFDVQILS